MDYQPLPFVVFDAQGEAGEPDRPFEVWEVCLRDAHVAPVGWDAAGRPAVPGCPYAVVCACKRSAIGALSFMVGRHRTAAEAHVALELLLEDWSHPEEVQHRAVLDRLIARRHEAELSAFESRSKRRQAPRLSLARRRAVPVDLSVDEGDLPF